MSVWRPHHSFGEACGSAGIDDDEVIDIPLERLRRSVVRGTASS